MDKDYHVVPLGQPGQVVLRSPFAFRGYLQHESSGMQLAKDGWIYTGDGGVLTEGGYIKVIGRRSDIISQGSILIYPSVVEGMISNFPGGAKVCMFGSRLDIVDYI